MTTIASEPELERLPLQECAYALSIALACFAAWAWFASAGVWAAIGAGSLAPLVPQAAGFILLAVLSFIVQIAANVAAAAARQAQTYKLPNEFQRARVLMILGGAFNAVSLHHAFTLVGFLTGDFAFLVWALAGALAFYEPAQYWIDEALAHERAGRAAKRDAAERAANEARNNRLDAEDRRRRDVSAPSSQPSNVESLDAGRRRSRGGGRAVLAAGLAAASPLAANAADLAPAAIVQAAERPVEARQPSIEEVEDARYQLNARGVRPSLRSVAAHLCVRKCDIEAVWPKGVPLAFADAA